MKKHTLMWGLGFEPVAKRQGNLEVTDESTEQLQPPKAMDFV